MKIPKFWAHSQAPNAIRQPGGKAYWVECWQWSDTSLAEAQQRADDKVRELVLKVQSGATLERYGYGEHPLREEMLQGIQTSAGREVGVVTHNKYGARVLNAASAMFIDVDFDSGQGFSMARQVARVMTGQAANLLDAYVAPIRDWASQHPDVGLRLYRTAGGLRCLVTNQVFDPTSAESLQMLEAMGSDPLYVRLCRAQGCFRARLTHPFRSHSTHAISRFCLPRQLRAGLAPAMRQRCDSKQNALKNSHVSALLSRSRSATCSSPMRSGAHDSEMRATAAPELLHV